jgi:O-antigen ligase
MNTKEQEFYPLDQLEGFSVKPIIMALFFLLLTTYSYNHVFRVGINLYMSDLLVIAIMLFTIVQLFYRGSFCQYRNFKFLFSLLFMYYLFLIFYSYAILGNDLNMVFGRFRMLFFYPLLFFPGLLFTSNKRDVDRYLRMIEIYVLISVIIGLLSLKFPALNLIHRFKEGDSGVIQDESPYFMIVSHGTALLCCLILIGGIFPLLKEPKKIFKPVFFMAISLVGIMGTQNRGILIVTLLSLFLSFFFSRKGEQLIRIRIKKAIFSLIILFVGFVFILTHSPIYEKFEERIDNTIKTFTGEKYFFHSVTGIRIGRTITTFKEWLKTPLIGCGWGNQIKVYYIYDLEGNYVRTNYGTPHNYYLTILYQTGIPGFAIMICIFYGIYRSLKPREPLNRENTTAYSLFIFYLAFLVFNIANTHLYAHPVFIPVNFFLLGTAVSYSHQLKND